MKSNEKIETTCETIRPLLYRIAESEVSPDEAMRTARHLSDCTACRILMARERRLAALLEEDLAEPLQVGEEFVESVMANLPSEPPPAPRDKRKRKRGLKLAGLLGLLALVPMDAWRAPDLTGPAASLPRLSGPSLDGLPGILDTLGGLAGGVLMVIDAIATSLPVLSLPTLGLAAVAIALAIPAAAGFVGAAGLVAVATHRWVR